MNWTECEKTIHEILLRCLNQTDTYLESSEDEGVFLTLAESEIASFINQHFGLENDKSKVLLTSASNASSRYDAKSSGFIPLTSP